MYTPYLSIPVNSVPFKTRKLEKRTCFKGKELLFAEANLQDNRFRLRQAANPGSQIESILARYSIWAFNCRLFVSIVCLVLVVWP